VAGRCLDNESYLSRSVVSLDAAPILIARSPRDELCKHFGELLKLVRLFQHGPIAVAIPHAVIAIAGREDERHFARDERAGNGIANFTFQVHIQQGSIEGLRTEEGICAVPRQIYRLRQIKAYAPSYQISGG